MHFSGTSAQEALELDSEPAIGSSVCGSIIGQIGGARVEHSTFHGSASVITVTMRLRNGNLPASLGSILSAVVQNTKSRDCDESWFCEEVYVRVKLLYL